MTAASVLRHVMVTLVTALMVAAIVNVTAFVTSLVTMMAGFVTRVTFVTGFVTTTTMCHILMTAVMIFITALGTGAVHLMTVIFVTFVTCYRYLVTAAPIFVTR